MSGVALPPYTRTPVTTADGTPVVGWSWPAAPVFDEAAPCKCSHLKRNHGTDRRDRAMCFGSAVCACTTYRPQETTAIPARFDERYDPSPEPIDRKTR